MPSQNIDIDISFTTATGSHDSQKPNKQSKVDSHHGQSPDKKSVSKSAGSQQKDQSQTKKKSPEDTLQSADTITMGCGYGEFQPTWLQVFHNAKCLLVCLSMCTIMQGIICNGLVPVSLSSLERRFRLTSTESGLFASFYDVAVTFCLLPVGHFGGKGNKPRWVGVGIIIMAIGSVITSLPQFLIGPLQHKSQLTDKCSLNLTFSETDNGEKVSFVGLYIILLIGQALTGVGASPLYTLGVTYLDENVPQSASPVYLGFFHAFSILGPAIGFVSGGMFLRIYGDIGKVGTENITIKPEDPRWYGAWWMGFLLFGVLSVVISVPVLAFAHRLPGTRAERKKDIDQAHGEKLSSMSKDIKDMPKEMLNLVKNYPYDCIIVMKTSEAFLMNAFINFVPKMLENFFNFSASISSFISGGVLIPGGFLGTVIGGFIMRRYKLRCGSMLMMAFIFQFISLLFIFGFFVICGEGAFVGVNAAPTDSKNQKLNYTPGEVINECNKLCSCSNYYDPVCSNLNENYYSPCHAGCMEEGPGEKKWSDCTCVRTTNTTNTTRIVEQGYCKVECNLAVVFLILLATQILVTFIAAMPVEQAELRIVTFQQRTLAVSFGYIFIRVLGAIPGPVVLGYAIDNSCVLWKVESNKEASCLRYNSMKMAESIVGLGVFFKMIICVFLLAAWWLYHPKPDEPIKIEKQTNKVPEANGKSTAKSTTG